MKIEAIIPAAGYGIRLKSNTGKIFVEIKHIPIIIRTLKVLDIHPLIAGTIVIVQKKDLHRVKHYAQKFKIKKIKKIIAGGRLRKDSVNNGLKKLDKDTDYVVIHDAVRPFLTKKIITACIKDAKKIGASVAAVPIKPTVKTVRHLAGRIFVEKTLKRSGIWEIQTPQVFKKDIILKAYKRFKGISATDDAALVERLGYKVAITPGSYSNIKITTSEDLLFAEAMASE